MCQSLLLLLLLLRLSGDNSNVKTFFHATFYNAELKIWFSNYQCRRQTVNLLLNKVSAAIYVLNFSNRLNVVGVVSNRKDVDESIDKWLVIEKSCGSNRHTCTREIDSNQFSIKTKSHIHQPNIVHGTRGLITMLIRGYPCHDALKCA